MEKLNVDRDIELIWQLNRIQPSKRNRREEKFERKNISITRREEAR